jgi:hypothetical protein
MVDKLQQENKRLRMEYEISANEKPSKNEIQGIDICLKDAGVVKTKLEYHNCELLRIVDEQLYI